MKALKAIADGIVLGLATPFFMAGACIGYLAAAIADGLRVGWQQWREGLK